MLQRIQTVFLSLALLINLAVLWVPAWQVTEGGAPALITGLAVTSSDGETEEETAFHEHTDSTKQSSHIAYFSLTLVAALLLLIIIFRYSHRMQQVKLSYLVIFLLMGEILALILLAFSSNSTDSTPHFGIAFPVAAIILITMAIRRIKADEELVKSVDRIR